MDSAAPVFHYFSSLPFELRREIYLFATPPRVVHVQESCYIEDHDDFDAAWLKSTLSWQDFVISYQFAKFKERYQTQLIPKLHPDLVHFAYNWHELIFDMLEPKQTILESYGFTSSKPPHQAWPPTMKTPEIPHHLLQDDLEVAFELTRECHLYSEAPIPPLLHTCAESRTTLQNYGYQLTFSTRTHGPRTWFHFDRDSLYISERTFGVPECDILSGSGWDVGQFDPRDLCRVKQLVMGKLRSAYVEWEDCIAGLLPLLPNLEQVFVEQWD